MNLIRKPAYRHSFSSSRGLQRKSPVSGKRLYMWVIRVGAGYESAARPPSSSRVPTSLGVEWRLGHTKNNPDEGWAAISRSRSPVARRSDAPSDSERCEKSLLSRQTAIEFTSPPHLQFAAAENPAKTAVARKEGAITLTNPRGVGLSARGLRRNASVRRSERPQFGLDSIVVKLSE